MDELFLIFLEDLQKIILTYSETANIRLGSKTFYEKLSQTYYEYYKDKEITTKDIDDFFIYHESFNVSLFISDKGHINTCSALGIISFQGQC